jgi:hypothetical protein
MELKEEEVKKEEKELIIIGKVHNDEWKFIYKNELNITTCVIGKKLDITDRNQQYLMIITEILEYFKDVNKSNLSGSANKNVINYDKLSINIPNLFMAECVENWIDKWKENNFYIDKEKTKERPNRTLLIQISDLKEYLKNTNCKVNIVFNYRL